MVAGHLQEKKGYYYMVLSYRNAMGNRKTKWFPTKLPVKGNKKRAEAMLMELRKTFEPEDKPISDDILFSDFMLQWLEVVKPTIAITTYSSYSNMVKSVIAPYFKKKRYNPEWTKGNRYSSLLYGTAKTGKAELCHPLSR